MKCVTDVSPVSYQKVFTFDSNDGIKKLDVGFVCAS